MAAVTNGSALVAGSAARAQQGAEVAGPVEVPQLVGIGIGVDRLDLTLGNVERHDSNQPVLRVERHRGLTVDLGDPKAHATARQRGQSRPTRSAPHASGR